MIRALAWGLVAAAVLGVVLLTQNGAAAQTNMVQDWRCAAHESDSSRTTCRWTAFPGATSYTIQDSNNLGATLGGQYGVSGGVATSYTIRRNINSWSFRIRPNGVNNVDWSHWVGGPPPTPTHTPTATATVDPRATPTATATPGPVMLMQAALRITNASESTNSAAMVPVDIALTDLQARGLMPSGITNLLVCPQTVRCWESTRTLYPANARGPVPTSLSSGTYRVYAPQLVTGDHITYDFYISRVSITRPGASGVSNGAEDDYRTALSQWRTYQPTYHGAVETNLGAFVGPENPDAGGPDAASFAGVTQNPGSGLPGYEFLRARSVESGVPLRWLWTIITFPLVMLVIGIVQRIFDNIIYSVCAGGFALVALCSPAVGLAVVWVVIFYAILSGCVIVIGRRLSAGI